MPIVNLLKQKPKTMNVNSKHIATFLLGAAAGAAIMKYNSMTSEEKEEMLTKLKEQATDLKEEAEKATTTASNYMEELKEKGMASLKDFLGDTESKINDIFNSPKKAS
jgi:hypothetical protein